MKSTVEEIRTRFDADVDRFSDSNVGHAATIDAKLALDLVADAAFAVSPHAQHLLDIGCGGGNYAITLLQRFANADVTLIDLSRPMLDRATERVAANTAGQVVAIQSDVRDVQLESASVDVVVAASVLHHLRTDEQWASVFARLFDVIRPGGSLWIVDLIRQENAAVQNLIWQRYGDHLVTMRDESYRDEVYAYVEKEDTPQTLPFQLDLMRQVGFRDVDVLHKNTCFAAFGGVKP